MSRAVRKCEKPEHCSGFSMWCGMAGTLPGGYLRPGLRMPDSQLPMPDFFFSGVWAFREPRGFPFPVCPGGFRISGFAPILSPSRVCGRCVCPSGLLPPRLRLRRRAGRAAASLSCGCCRPGSACRRFVARGFGRRELVPAVCCLPASVRPDFVRVVFVRSLFLRLLRPPVCAVSGFFPAGFFRLFCAGASSPESGSSSSPVSLRMSFSSGRSSSEQKAMACPSRPARPVRPMRWT